MWNVLTIVCCMCRVWELVILSGESFANLPLSSLSANIVPADAVLLSSVIIYIKCIELIVCQ